MKNNNDLSPLHKIVVGAQFLFVAFGATVLVPLLVGLCGFVVDGRPSSDYIFRGYGCNLIDLRYCK